MRITINTDVNAPGCPCEILAEDGRSLLVQTDWDYPGIAESFGWSTREVQKCKACGSRALEDGACLDCGEAHTDCTHDHTDGTVGCPDCGIDAGQFIAAAGQFLQDNDGLSADDPGYFDND